MGNCLTCFKEPPAAPQDNLQNCHKEDMPEVRLYAAPSHVPASAPPSQTVISNGNHLSSTPLPVVAGDTQSTVVNRFYPLPGRKTHSKSAPVMGLLESKQPSEGKLNALFDVYKDENEDCILAEGIEQLCKDLQIPPEDYKILLFAWKLNAEQMCRFTRSEFVNGMRAIRVDSVKAIQARLPEIANEVDRSPELFKDLYRFTFKFGLDSAAGQRILPTDMAVVLWQLVFSRKEPPILRRWLDFLDTHQHAVRGVPRDTWYMFLNFSETIGDELSSYDDTEAWPSLFDDFVEYENDRMNQNFAKDNKECEGILRDDFNVND
ncbi:hypothetical protein WA026_001372 [Henosepilachna vigintioctopunctata]|uniref:Defective in cullin neddylation protein n=1 Tax=Henosepilachna vigintioctopunctata TaxID=420089 RepID=A0AAW1UQZ6_9CUCU